MGIERTPANGPLQRPVPVATPEDPAKSAGAPRSPRPAARDLVPGEDPEYAIRAQELVTPKYHEINQGLQPQQSASALQQAAAKGKPVAMAKHADAAKLTKKPTKAQLKEIKDAVKAGARQKAIDLTIKYYGIDTSNVAGKVTYDASLTSADATTKANRSIKIGPSVFQNHSTGFIASTILHEVTHANQIKAHGFPKNGQDVRAYDAMGYQVGLENAAQLGLTAAETSFYKSYSEKNRKGLKSANRALYDKGQYWGMSP